ncbi:LysR family regulatory protein CidR [Vibrio cholerae]|nr:LysR family regulatory protein CidR [Vibrio cholerae]
MDIRALRYFVELVNQQSFTKASERLFVTQPTISKMIRNLEQELEQPLLHREGRRFWLTEAGEIVYQRAQQILTQMQQLDAETHGFKPTASRPFAFRHPAHGGACLRTVISSISSNVP